MNNKANIVIAGDIFPFPINEEYFRSGAAGELVDDKLLELFRNADYSVCNLEGCLFSGDTQNKKSGVRIKADPSCINGYKAMGFDCICVANNHATDFGPEGFYSTREAISGAGLDIVGDCDSTEKRNNYKSLDINGVKIALYAVSEELFNAPTATTPGANIYEEYRVCKEIEKLKEAFDHVLVLYHGGQEHYQYRDPQMKKRFYNMVEAGASFIIAQHTHVIGLEENYKGAILVYGQGNSLFHYSEKPNKVHSEGIIIELEVSKESIEMKKHLIRRKGAGAIYDPKQDLSDMNERSRRLAQGEEFEDEFRAFIYGAARKKELFPSMRGKNRSDNDYKEEYNAQEFYSYIRTRFSVNQLYKLLKFFKMDEFNELATEAIKDLIREKELEQMGVEPDVPQSTDGLSDYEKAFRKFGCMKVEYDVFEFDKKTEEEQSEYITLNTAKYRFYHLTKDLENRSVLKDKNATFKKLHDFYNRDAIQRNDRKAFIEFAKKHNAFICKPTSGTGGKGMLFGNLEEMGMTAEEYFDTYLDGNGYDVEELIIQDPAMAKFHPQSINTVRPVTFLKDGEVTFLFVIMRIGTGDSHVDNLSSGGICVAVDADTGKIISGAINRTELTPIQVHPDTGVVFMEESIPYWNELKETVTKAAKALKDPPIVGWDMALGQNGWTIVEANWNPTLREFQMLTGKGLRPRFEEITGESFGPNPAGYTGDKHFDMTGKKSKKNKKSKKSEKETVAAPKTEAVAAPASKPEEEPKKGFFASLFK